MRDNPERLAWTVLLISSFVCMGLIVATPLGIRHYVLTATVAQHVILEVPRGPLRVTMAGRGEPVAIAEMREDIPERTIIATDSTVGRLVMIAPDRVGSVIASVQLYNNTEVMLSSARSPRFSTSSLEHIVELEISTGRVRINISSDNGRPTRVRVQTAHGTATLSDVGSYEVKTNGTTTTITTFTGQAEVMNQAGEILSLDPAQRVLVSTNRIDGPLPPPTNLVSDGGFGLPLEANWHAYQEQEQQPPGEISISADEGQNVAVFYRSGSDHAEVGIRQEINYDVGDFTALELHLNVKIEEHDVPVCGTYGSECPIMVRIDYVDANGADQEWLQGFYWLTDASVPGNPSVCVTCSTRYEHIRIPVGTWYPYLSQNLIPLLSYDGQPPTMIKAFTIYASGHSFRALVAEIELTGQ